MEYSHNSLESIVYAWSVFAFLGMMAAFNAEGMAVKHAALVSVASDRPVPAPLLRIYVILLTTYSMILFYVFMIVLCLILYSAMSIAHLSVEAMFRLDPYWLKKSWVRWTLFLVDNLADPGLVFSFMSKRIWAAHLGVAVTSIAVGAAHAMAFVTRNRLRGMGVDPMMPLPPTLLPKLIVETNSIVLSIMTTLYISVFLREILLFYQNAEK